MYNDFPPLFLTTFAGLKLRSTSLVRRRSSVANSQLSFRHTSKLYSTSPTSDDSSKRLVLDPNFVISLIFVSVSISMYLFGQNVKLEAKSDVNDIAEKLVVRIDSKFAEQEAKTNAKFAEQEAKTNAKFAEQAKTLDELKDLKTEAGVVVACVAFVGFTPLTQYLTAFVSQYGPKSTNVSSEGDSDGKKT